jgi:hypothetical protein
VGAAGDSYEQEADRVAEQVLSASPPQIGSAPPNEAPGSGEGVSGGLQRSGQEEEGLQAKPLATALTPLVQREGAGDDEALQAKETVGSEPGIGSGPRAVDPMGSFEAGADVEARLAASRGGGQPLAEGVRDYMEPRFGADLSGVRVHTGSEASGLSRAISAQAFTHGQDIYVGEGKYDPGSTAGKRLLAHELAHTIQQSGAQPLSRAAGQAARRKRLLSVRPQALERRPAGIQRLSVQNTQWNTVTRITATGEGGQGVLFFDDGMQKVVVKPNVHADEEQVASMLHQAVGEQAATAGQGWHIGALDVRIATAQDVNGMHTAATRVFGGNPPPGRVSDLLGLVAPGNTMIQKLAAQGKGEGGTVGGRMSKMTEGGGHTSWYFGKQRVKKDSPIKLLLNKPGFVFQLGAAAATDIFTGNFDRIAGAANFENWMISKSNQAIYLIDNVVDKPSGQFSQWISEHGAFGAVARTVQPVNFTAWAALPLVQALAAGQFMQISQAIWSSSSMGADAIAMGLQSTMTDELLHGMTSGTDNRFVGPQDQSQVSAKLAKHMTMILQNFTLGLQNGKNAILGFNGGFLPWTVNVSQEARIVYRARVLVTGGMAANAAWAQARADLGWRRAVATGTGGHGV